MGIKVFEIFLDNPKRNYVAGQKLSGWIVILVLDQVKKVQGVSIKLSGQANTHWNECSGRTTRTVGDCEHYINKKIVLYGSVDNPASKELGLQPGCHEFPFNFTLPVSLPSSFEHKYGSVKYLLEATITRLAKSDYTTKLNFTVQGNVNLNHEPNLTEALYARKSSKKTTNYCLCFTSGPIGFFCKIPRSGFVPGENIPFSAELYNFSQRPVQKVTLSLVQETKFSAKSSILRSKFKSMTVFSVRGPALGPGADETWCPEGLRIPDIPPTKLGGCSIITVSYCLKFKVEAKNSNTLKSKLSILIGTIPIRLTSQYMNLTGMVMQPSQLIRNELRLPSSSTTALSRMYSLPPPRYEDVVLHNPPGQNNQGISEEDGCSLKTCSSENPPDYEESFRLQHANRTEN